MDWKSSLRQYRYPKEFRIAPPALPADLRAQLKELAALLQQPPATPGGLKPKSLADVCTNLWRLRGKMIGADSGRPLEEMKRAYRHFESAWDALAAAGVKIYDHTGEFYDPGRALQVMAFQPTPGLSRDTILETIKPTIYFHDSLLQTGEVIVGASEESPKNQ